MWNDTLKDRKDEILSIDFVRYFHSLTLIPTPTLGGNIPFLQIGKW